MINMCIKERCILGSYLGACWPVDAAGLATDRNAGPHLITPFNCIELI